MSLDTFNHPLKIWASIWTPTPKMGVHLTMWGFIPSHFPTLSRAWNATLRLHSWPAPLQALALVSNPRLKLWQAPLIDLQPFVWMWNPHPTFSILLTHIVHHDLIAQPTPILPTHLQPPPKTYYPTYGHQFTLWRLTLTSILIKHPIHLNQIVYDHSGPIPSHTLNPLALAWT